MAYDSKVIIKILGDATDFNKTINSAEASLNSLKGLLAKLGLGVSLGATVKEIVSNTNALEDAMATASTLFGDVNVDMDNFKKKVTELSDATGQSATAITNSLYNAFSSGVEVTEDMGTAMGFMETASKLAVAGLTDVDSAVDVLAKTMNAYGMTTDDVDQIAKNLVQTQNMGIVTVGELSQFLANVTPTASAYGVSLEDVGASLSVMTKAGTNASSATTNLNRVLLELVDNESETAKNLKKATKEVLGQEMSFSDLQEKSYNLQEVLLVMSEYADKAGLSIADLFSSSNAKSGAIQIAKDVQTYTDYIEAMESETDIVQESYEKMMSTRSKSWTSLINKLKNISIKIGNSEVAQRILDDLTTTAQKMLDNVEAWLPDALDNLNKFYLQAKLVFSYLEGAYERSFLKKGVDFVISVVSDEWDKLKESFESGDIFGTALKLVGDLITINVGFHLVSELGNLVLDGFSKVFGSRNGALMLVADALMVYVGFKQAQESGDWETFGSKLVSAIVLGATMAGLTGNLSAGLLVFGIAFNVDDGDFVRGLNKLSEYILEFMNDYAESLDKWNAMFGKETHYGDEIITPKEAKAIEEEKKRLEEEDASVQEEIEGLKTSIDSKKKALEEVLGYLEQIGVVENKTIKKEDLGLVGNMMQRVSNGVSPSDAYNEYAKAEQLYLQQVGDDMVITAEDALSAVRNELLSLWDTDVGRNAILGIYGSFSKEELANIGIEAGKNLLDAVKEELGIHSPSKEFEKIGDYCVQGLAEGMTKSDAKDKLDSAFDTIYENMRIAVENGEMSLQEAFAELETMLELADQYTSRIDSYVPASSTTAVAKNKPQIFTPALVESEEETKSVWQKFFDWFKNACSDAGKWLKNAGSSASSWLFSDLGLKDADGNPLKDEEGNLVEFGKTGLDVVNEVYSQLTSLSGYFNDIITADLENQISAMEEARDTAKKYNELTIEEEKEYDKKIKALKKEQFEKQKRANIATAVMDGALAIMNIWSENEPITASILSAIAGATTVAQISAISSQQSGYEHGGLIGGHGYTGDKQQIWANAGELILNRTQQRAIADQLSYGGNTTVIQVEFNGNVFGEQQTVAEYVYDAIKTAQAQGALRAW